MHFAKGIDQYANNYILITRCKEQDAYNKVHDMLLMGKDAESKLYF